MSSFKSPKLGDMLEWDMDEELADSRCMSLSTGEGIVG